MEGAVECRQVPSGAVGCKSSGSVRDLGGHRRSQHRGPNADHGSRPGRLLSLKVEEAPRALPGHYTDPQTLGEVVEGLLFDIMAKKWCWPWELRTTDTLTLCQVSWR